jgi:hypothetical protein
MLIIGLFSSCADSKVLNINGKDVLVEPYGWMDETEFKNDSVVYRVNTGNIIWSIVGVETIFVPVVLTGKYLYEPVSKIEQKQFNK